MSETKSETTPQHDFFASLTCKKAGKSTEDAVRRIQRWAEALIEVSPIEVIFSDEPPPAADNLEHGAAAIEGLAYAIFYETARLADNLPSRAICCEAERNRKRMHGLHDARPKKPGPKTVTR